VAVVERVVIHRSFTLYKTFYEGGVATDPDSPPTVIITRESDGTTVSAGAVADEASTGQWSVTVAAAENDLLDTLIVDWAAVVNGASQEHIDYVEVAGGTVFTIPELTAVKPQYATWTTAQMAEMRVTVETAFETEYGTAVVPRYARETITAGVAPDLLQLKPVVRSIRDATVDGTALTASQLADLTWTPSGNVYGYPLTGYYSNIVVGYEYGLPHPPPRIKQGLLRLAKQWLTNGPIDDRAAVYNIAEGGTYSMVVPGRNGSTFGMPELDAIINQSPYRIGVA
jgi:hypothetical protein